MTKYTTHDHALSTQHLHLMFLNIECQRKILQAWDCASSTSELNKYLDLKLYLKIQFINVIWFTYRVHAEVCIAYMLQCTKLHFKLPTAERRHLLCVWVGGDQTHATCSRGAGYTHLDQIGHWDMLHILHKVIHRFTHNLHTEKLVRAKNRTHSRATTRVCSHMHMRIHANAHAYGYTCSLTHARTQLALVHTHTALHT